MNLVAASVLMSLLYGARIARFDLLRAIGGLATKLTKWTTLEDRKLGDIVVVGVAWILKSWVFVEPFVLGPLHGHFLHFLFLPDQPAVVRFNLRMRIWEGHQLLAVSTIQEIKRHSRRWPSLRNYAEQAIHMENVPAAQQNRRLIS